MLRCSKKWALGARFLMKGRWMAPQGVGMKVNLDRCNQRSGRTRCGVFPHIGAGLLLSDRCQIILTKTLAFLRLIPGFHAAAWN